jgi:hypothetical protein
MCRPNLDIAMRDLEPGALAGCDLPVIRSDKAREFLVASLVSWSSNMHGLPLHRKGGVRRRTPYAERFNGTATRETLNCEDFHNVLESRVVLEAWGRRVQ